jgi:hypothetical protein
LVLLPGPNPTIAIVAICFLWLERPQGIPHTTPPAEMMAFLEERFIVGVGANASARNSRGQQINQTNPHGKRQIDDD